MGISELLLGVLLAAAASLILLGLPLLKGRVAPNRFYGYRTPQTLRDPAAWYSANRVCGFWLMATGFITAAVAAVTYAAKLPVGWQVFSTLATLGCGVIVMALASDAAARRPASEVKKTRLQFGLLGLFIVTTVAAIACAILRLPLPWVLKLGLLWAYFICVIGLAVRNMNTSALARDEALGDKKNSPLRH